MKMNFREVKAPLLNPEARRVAQRAWNAVVSAAVLAAAWMAMLGIGWGLSAVFEVGLKGVDVSPRTAEIVSQIPVMYVVVLAFAMTLSAAKDVIGIFFSDTDSVEGSPTVLKPEVQDSDGEQIS